MPLWEEYFGPLDQGQQAVVESLSETLPDAVTSNGATMTPLAAFGGQGAAVSRVIYTIVALAGIWCISLFFRDREELIEHKD